MEACSVVLCGNEGSRNCRIGIARIAPTSRNIFLPESAKSSRICKNTARIYEAAVLYSRIEISWDDVVSKRKHCFAICSVYFFLAGGAQRPGPSDDCDQKRSKCILDLPYFCALMNSLSIKKILNLYFFFFCWTGGRI